MFQSYPGMIPQSQAFVLAKPYTKRPIEVDKDIVPKTKRF
jgi:hypothetical protein